MNLVSGNYEFACLLVGRLRRILVTLRRPHRSELGLIGTVPVLKPRQRVAGRLVTEDTWSNEGLFVLTQGLRRLKQIGGKVSDIEWTVG